MAWTGPLREVRFGPTLEQGSAEFACVVCVHEPLWSTEGQHERVARELVVVCCQLEQMLVEDKPVSPAHQRALRRAADSQLKRLPAPQPTLGEYLRDRELGTVCPNLAAIVQHEEHMTSQGHELTAETDWQRPVTTGSVHHCLLKAHFKRVAVLNQVVVMAKQLSSTVEGPNHKHVAHQLSLLHQSVFALGEPLKAYKKAIEQSFVKIKAATRQRDDGDFPQLPVTFRDWVLELCTGLVGDMLALPGSLTEPLEPVVDCLLDHEPAPS
eukprot:m.98505 g.98505  ORF g.98505 m.98505 type:complete len:268 (-) comp15280_c0_seq1:75-878(-)